MTSPKLSTLLDWNHPRWYQNVSVWEKYYEATTSDFTHKRNIQISTPSLRIPACVHCCAEKYRGSLSPNPVSVSPLVIFAYCTTWNFQPLRHETFLVRHHPGLTMAFSVYSLQRLWTPSMPGVLKLQLAFKSPGGLVKIQVSGPHPYKFWLKRSGAGLENVHFWQVPRQGLHLPLPLVSYTLRTSATLCTWVAPWRKTKRLFQNWTLC